jgi:hypothetical protein
VSQTRAIFLGLGSRYLTHITELNVGKDFPAALLPELAAFLEKNRKAERQ